MQSTVDAMPGRRKRTRKRFDITVLNDVDIGAVAAWLNCSPRRVGQLVADGIVPAPKRQGHYDLIEIDRAWHRYLEAGHRKDTLSEIRRRRESEELRLARAKADVAEGNVVQREDHERVGVEAMTIVAAELEGLGGRLAHEFAAMSEPALIRQRLVTESRRIRASAAAKLREVLEQTCRPPSAA